MKILIIMIFISILNNPLTLYSQSNIEWVKNYSLMGNCYAHALAIDCSNNVYVAGSAHGIDPFGGFATIKYNAFGDEQWFVDYVPDPCFLPGAMDIAVDESNNI